MHLAGERGDCPHGIDTTAPDFKGCQNCPVDCIYSGNNGVRQLSERSATKSNSEKK